jgi:hypothetical protein
MVTVKQNPEKPIEPQILAEAIVAIAGAARKLAASGLNKKAIIILLSASSGVVKRDCTIVLDHLEYLAKQYTK